MVLLSNLSDCLLCPSSYEVAGYFALIFRYSLIAQKCEIIQTSEHRLRPQMRALMWPSLHRKRFSTYPLWSSAARTSLLPAGCRVQLQNSSWTQDGPKLCEILLPKSINMVDYLRNGTRFPVGGGHSPRRSTRSAA